MVSRAEVPETWNNKDRIAYMKLGQKRVNEHIQYYACVALGCQLFVEMRNMRDDYKESHIEKCEEDK